MFPVEIWELILKYVDVTELLKFKRVSKSWHEIIPRVIEINHKWYEKCLKDVPEHSWGSILEHHMYPEISCENFHDASKYSHVWLSMYKSWIGWNNLIEKTPSVESIEVFPRSSHRNKISCLTATNKIIAIGGSEGYVSFYDISKFGGEPIFKVNRLTHIDAVQLGRKGTDIIGVAIHENGIESEIQHWDLRSKKRLHRSQCRTFMPLIRAHFEYCYTVESTTFLYEVHSLEIKRLGAESSRWVNFHLPEEEFVVAVRADGTKVTLAATDGKNKKIKLYTGLPNDEMKELYVTSLNPRGIRSFKIFESNVTACVDRQSKFGLSIAGGEWKFYDVSGGCYDILYHVGLLILGLESGEVRIFRVKNIEGLDALNLETTESRTVKLDTNSILSVAVTEYNSIQYIVASTREKLHLVKFE